MPEYQIDLGGSFCNFGELVRKSGRPSDSLLWFDKAIRTLAAVYEQERRLVVAKRFLRNSHAGRAEAYDRLQKFPEAVKDWDKAIELTPRAEQPRLRASRATARVKAGLVAEAVDKVCPDLVVRDEQGKPFTVRYDAVNAMVLNEFLKEHRKVEEQQAKISQLSSTVAQQQKTYQLCTAGTEDVWIARMDAALERGSGNRVAVVCDEGRRALGSKVPCPGVGVREELIPVEREGNALVG